MNRACFFTFSSCRLSILLASEQMIAAFLVVTPPSVDHQAEDPSVPRPRWTILASDTLPGLCLIRVTAVSRIRGARTAAKSACTRTAAAAPACREMLALLLFVVVSASLALFVAAGFVLFAAPSQGTSTAPWVSLSGVGAFVSFWGSELLGLAGVSLLGMLVALMARSVGTSLSICVAYVLIA